jgi:hypothetical protein
MVRQHAGMRGRIGCRRWLARIFDLLCGAFEASEAADTISASGVRQSSGGRKGVQRMRLTVVTGAAAGHAALGRCSSVVLHFDVVLVCVRW